MSDPLTPEEESETQEPLTLEDELRLFVMMSAQKSGSNLESLYDLFESPYYLKAFDGDGELILYGERGTKLMLLTSVLASINNGATRIEITKMS